jgi:hypothetical protein
VTPEKRADVGKIAKVLELHAEFRQAGMRVDEPKNGSNRPSRPNRPNRPNGHRRHPRPARRGH